jgi:hypothetical protein
VTSLPVSEIRKADPEARRRAILVVVFGAAIGALLIAGFEELRQPLHDWLMSDPAQTPRRARLVIALSAVLLAAPLITFAVYLWLLGVKVVRAQQYPPPGLRVIRDTPVVSGPGAVTRGQAIQVGAVCLGVSAAVLCLFFWWLTGTAGTVTQ